MKSHKALFLSVHGGGESSDPISGIPTSLGVVLCYILPIKQSGKDLVIHFACGVIIIVW